MEKREVSRGAGDMGSGPWCDACGSERERWVERWLRTRGRGRRDQAKTLPGGARGEQREDEIG